MKVKRIVANLAVTDPAQVERFCGEALGLDAALARLRAAGFAIEYGPATEPWGVRRFYVRDPFGKRVNVLAHV